MSYSRELSRALLIGLQGKAEASYLYCVAESGEGVCLGAIGLDGQEVYTIPYHDVCAVVHNCLAEPYRSSDPERVKAWVMAHHQVVEAAWGRWGTVLPLSFDTLVWGGAGGSPAGNVQGWLQKDYEHLKGKMDRVRGKAEYGVQVFWQPGLIARALARQNPVIAQMEAEIRIKPRGLAYLYEQKLAILLKKELENKAAQCFSDFYPRLKKHTDDLRVERTKNDPADTQMILNLSCLVSDGLSALQKELGVIAQLEGFAVRFTGPWPPYSFVHH